MTYILIHPQLKIPLNWIFSSAKLGNYGVILTIFDFLLFVKIIIFVSSSI